MKVSKINFIVNEAKWEVIYIPRLMKVSKINFIVNEAKWEVI
jgi:hypothetical protein